MRPLQSKIRTKNNHGVVRGVFCLRVGFSQAQEYVYRVAPYLSRAADVLDRVWRGLRSMPLPRDLELFRKNLSCSFQISLTACLFSGTGTILYFTDHRGVSQSFVLNYVPECSNIPFQFFNFFLSCHTSNVT